MKSKYGVVFAVLAAAVALCAVGVSSASAAGGPEWLVKEAKLTGTKSITVTATGAHNVQFRTESLTFECKSESGAGNIVGGNPGTGEVTLLFKECSTEGKTVKECALSSVINRPEGGASGEVEFKVKAVLIYEGLSGERTRADEAFFPEGVNEEVNGKEVSHPNAFVMLETHGTRCGGLEESQFKLEATGTEVKEPTFNSDCGILMEVGEIKAGGKGEFKRTASGVTTTSGGLDSEYTRPPEKGELWQSKPETYKDIDCKTTLIGAQSVVAALFKVETVPAEAFGWQI
jgi:hypothetical protein